MGRKFYFLRNFRAPFLWKINGLVRCLLFVFEEQICDLLCSEKLFGKAFSAGTFHFEEIWTIADLRALHFETHAITLE
jgi:hypothetical protein